MRPAIYVVPAVLAVVLLGVVACSPEEGDSGGGFLPSGMSGNGQTTAGSGNGGAPGAAGTTAGGMSGGGTAAGGQNTSGAAMGGSASGAGGGGGSGGSGGPQKTTGCGKDPGQPTGEWQVYNVPLAGETLGQPHQHTSREIFVRLPANYEPNTAYRVIYIGVGCSAPDGASAAYPLWDVNQKGDPNAIYVALSLPEPAVNNNCYDNRAGVNSMEWESLDKDHNFVSDKFCIDNNKVYMGGYSSGGWIANMYSCYFGAPPTPPRKFLPNVALKGVMAVAGCWIDGNPTCNGPVAGLWIHDEGDGGANPYSCAVEQRDRLLVQNGCTGGADGPTEKWGEDIISAGECLRYTNCPPQYPVIFCTTTGRGHASQNDNAVAGFAKFVSDIEAAAP